MANLPLAFAEAGIGAILLTAGISGSPITDVVRGKVIMHPLSDNAITGASGDGGSGSGGSAGQPTNTAQLKPTISSLAKQNGWGPAEITAWLGVIAKESGGNLTSTNPGRTQAYGIAQFVDPSGTPQNQLELNKQKYYAYGGDPNTITGQLTAMANYIKQRYGTPSAALAAEYSQGWY